MSDITVSLISQPLSHLILIIKKESHDVSEHLQGGIQIIFNTFWKPQEMVTSERYQTPKMLKIGR